MQNTGYHLQQRTLAGSVLADDAESFASINLKADGSESPEIAMKGLLIEAGKLFEARAWGGVDRIALRDIAEFYDRRVHLLESTGGKNKLSNWPLK